MGTVTETPAAHQSYVPDEVTMPEFTPVPIIVGALLGIVFGASSIYLVLKVGMTVSASIPVAVLSITLFRGLSRLFGLARPPSWKIISCRQPAPRESPSRSGLG